jgi:hypothetical protein
MGLDEARKWWDLWNHLKPFFDKWFPYHRRWLWIAVFFGCVIFSGIHADFSDWLRIGWKGFFRWMDHPGGSWGVVWLYFWHGKRVLGELLFCALYAYIVCVLLTIFVKTVKIPSISSNKYQALILYLVDRLGIVHFYSTHLKQSVMDQDYASDMQNAVLTTTKVKMLCIAGYEYLGKGQDALLYNAIKNRPTISVEVIVLNPETGMGVINQRIQELQNRDNTITPAVIVEHIRKTLGTVRDLNLNRVAQIDAYTCRWHPIFRLLICDDVLFMSSYGKLAHGHETPVLRIDRKAPDNSATDTLYRSFENYFESLKTNSAKVQ